MMLYRSLVIAVLLAPAAAFAGDEVIPTATGVATDSATVTGTGPSIFKSGTLGLSVGVPSGTSDSQVNLTYFTSERTALDLLFGFDFAHTPDTTTGMPAMTTPGGTTVGLSVGAGYRMYKHHSQRIHTYLEPFAQVATADFGTISDNLMLAVGGALGAECMFTDWFSIRGQVGVALTVGSTFKAVELATNTSGLYANFYWE